MSSCLLHLLKASFHSTCRLLYYTLQKKQCPSLTIFTGLSRFRENLVVSIEFKLFMPRGSSDPGSIQCHCKPVKNICEKCLVVVYHILC